MTQLEPSLVSSSRESVLCTLEVINFIAGAKHGAKAQTEHDQAL